MPDAVFLTPLIPYFSVSTLARDVKEMPCWVWAPIMIVSMRGGDTGLSDDHSTMKLAPDPPDVSDSRTTKRVAASFSSFMGLERYSFKGLPLES